MKYKCLIFDMDGCLINSNEVQKQSLKLAYDEVVVSKDIGDNKYLSGFTYEDNSFFIYQKRLLTESEDPFTGVGD